jgi:hypothetical protein
MAGSKSKNKGKSWERDVANHLTELYGETFIRVPHSGAYIGGKNQFRKEFLHEGQIRSMKGDITPPLTWTKFNCECKSYADFPFHQLYSGEIKILESWLDQLHDAADPGDFNILIMKFNRKGKFIAVAHPWADIENQNYSIYRSQKYGIWYIVDYDLFWQHNKDRVQASSSANS